MAPNGTSAIDATAKLSGAVVTNSSVLRKTLHSNAQSDRSAADLVVI